METKSEWNLGSKTWNEAQMKLERSLGETLRKQVREEAQKYVRYDELNSILY